MFFYLIEQHSKFLLHTLQVLYICTLCDSTNINTIIEFVPHVSDDGFNGGSDTYLQFRDTHAPSLLKLCIPPSNGIVRWWLFPEFGVELPLDNCTPTIILNNPVHIYIYTLVFMYSVYIYIGFMYSIRYSCPILVKLEYFSTYFRKMFIYKISRKSVQRQPFCSTWTDGQT